MNSEPTSTSTEETTTNTTNNPTTNTVATTNSSLGRDLLIPISIVLAGACIGLGLYFNGGSPAGVGLPSAVETTAEKVERLANDAGVKTGVLAACLEDGRHKATVQAEVENAIASGGTGTPWSIIIGADGTTYPVNGALPTNSLEQLLEIVRAQGELPAELANEEADTDAVTPVTDADWVKGDRNAPIKIVEYSDFDCPFCGRFHESMDIVVRGNDDVAWVYRHFPLDRLHPEARYVAEAAECVGELGGEEAFWLFTDGYFAG